MQWHAKSQKGLAPRSSQFLPTVPPVSLRSTPSASYQGKGQSEVLCSCTNLCWWYPDLTRMMEVQSHLTSTTLLCLKSPIQKAYPFIKRIIFEVFKPSSEARTAETVYTVHISTHLRTGCFLRGSHTSHRSSLHWSDSGRKSWPLPS